MKEDKFYHKDPWLEPYYSTLDEWHKRYLKRKNELCCETTLKNFASGHLYYGMHRTRNGFVFREWAPNASNIFICGSFNNWKEKEEYRLKKINKEGDWEIKLDANLISHGDLYKLSVHWPGGSGERLPSYARSVIQDDSTLLFSCCNWMPEKAYQWKHEEFKASNSSPLIYEAHTGMSSEEEKVSTFIEFRDKVLPRIAANGYNTIQLMAIQEHPYYGSFGYHVSNFFAVSSRFGTPDDLKSLVDAAHGMGIAVIMDLVHSHSVRNYNEGLGLFAGDQGQYFHADHRRHHTAWDSLCFDYGKDHVTHFLLSNCRYWLEEYRIDGFRFDGITSMLYYDHGLEKNFTSYKMYFDGGQDNDARTYLSLANDLIHEINPDAISVAEEMSGMPGTACSVKQGGIGFDYRLSMGTPDYWIKIIKEQNDEGWNMDALFSEMTSHRAEEKTISYCESHDQALVGDKTLIFRLADADMYTAMSKNIQSLKIDRALALHKMIRLLTLSCAQSGYLNFMGNEFGHPEWIDFPREGNNWSYKYARRQWSLADNESLRYHCLNDFDKAMLQLVNKESILDSDLLEKIHSNNDNNILAFTRSDCLFVFNFHPSNSYTDYALPLKGKFRVILDTDKPDFGGYDRINSDISYMSSRSEAARIDEPLSLKLYLPSRTAIVLRKEESKRINLST